MPADRVPDHESYDDYDEPAGGRLRRTLRQRVIIGVGVVAVVGCLAGAFAFATVWRKWGAFERVDADTLDERASSEEPMNLLIVGSDSRDAIDASDPNRGVFTGGGEQPTGQRADTMVVLRYDPGRERLDVLSVPRDLWVPISGQDTTDRLNTAYSHDPDTLISTIQDHLDIPIHHYAEIDFQGFQDVVDEVGGVPMYFDTIYQDPNSGFVISEPGCVRLDGYMALAFVRSRHLEYMTPAGNWDSDPTGDLGRITRQQIFLRRVLEQARGSLSLLSFGEMTDMLDIGIDHVRLDEDLPPTQLAAMGQRFAEFEGDSIQTHTLPVTEFTTDGGAAVVRLDQGAAQPVLNIFRGVDPNHVDPGWVDLQILNGSGVKGQAADVEEAYEAIGFEVSSVGDVPGTEGAPLERTRVRYAPGSETLASLVERHLTEGGELVEDTDLSPGEVVVETALDFTTVEQLPRAPAVSGPTSVEAMAMRSGTGTDDTTSDTGTDGTTGTSDGGEAPTTATTVIGHATGEPPPGEVCE
jgi:polyisoprenyl-teichoic acid--peptidoglycan teichoic acid transferase